MEKCTAENHGAKIDGTTALCCGPHLLQHQALDVLHQLVAVAHRVRVGAAAGPPTVNVRQGVAGAVVLLVQPLHAGVVHVPAPRDASEEAGRRLGAFEGGGGGVTTPSNASMRGLPPPF